MVELSDLPDADFRPGMVSGVTVIRKQWAATANGPSNFPLPRSRASHLRRIGILPVSVQTGQTIRARRKLKA
jgi:hypothetical protein